MRFRATIQLNGKTATGIQVPPEVVAGLGSSKRPSVRVTLNGYTYRSTVAPMGGVFMLPVSAEVREGAHIAAGDAVDVDLEPDSEPREVTVPPDFADALDGDADAKRFFAGLSYSHKRRWVLSIEEAKTTETRQKRIAKAVSDLREGRP
ncbi:MAG TPA: YdeI/OmpD-associated family protein [Ktedonobacterales bacterium]|nr:YdeI/OmpD-associated family protein [Ktedonobacterales bacterium]